MKSLLASVLLSSVLLPACLSEPEELETSEVEGELLLSTTTTRSATKIATSGSGYALWGRGFTTHVRLYSTAGTPLAGVPVTLKSSTGTTWTTYTDFDGVAEVYAYDYVHLGTLGPRTFTWSYAGTSTQAAASASFSVTFLRTDCTLEYLNSRIENGKHELSASLRRSGKAATEGGHAIEFRVDGKLVGTALTQAGNGSAELTLPAPIDHGTLDVQFAGNTTIAGCAASREFDLTPTPVRLWVAPNLSQAKIGASTVTLHAHADVMSSFLPTPRPNTRMRIFVSRVGVIGNLYDSTPVGEVTTGPDGDAYLTLPVTSVVGSPRFPVGKIAFTATSDDPVISDELYQTNYATSHTMVVNPTDVKLNVMGQVINADGTVTRTYAVTNAATGKGIAKVELDGACNDWANAYTDAYGRLTCTYTRDWFWSNALNDWAEDYNLALRYPDAWNQVWY